MKTLKNLLRKLLSKAVKFESRIVYDYHLKKSVTASYMLLFGIYIKTIYK
ncbi:hypothetical protein [Flavobacterium phage fF4]|nr:hypothetical protein [Flavobacterium phage fF4]